MGAAPPAARGVPGVLGLGAAPPAARGVPGVFVGFGAAPPAARGVPGVFVGFGAAPPAARGVLGVLGVLAGGLGARWVGEGSVTPPRAAPAALLEFLYCCSIKARLSSDAITLCILAVPGIGAFPLSTSSYETGELRFAVEFESTFHSKPPSSWLIMLSSDTLPSSELISLSE